MTRKLLYLVFIFCITSTAVRSQQLVVTPSDTISLDTVVSSWTTTVSRTVTLTNNSAVDTFTWRVLENTMPHSWVTSYCDPRNCLNGIPANGELYFLAPSHTGTMILDVTPHCQADTGVLQILTWAPLDSANTSLKLTWKVTIGTQNCYPAGITSLSDANQITFYPNPIKNDLHLNLPQNLDNGQVDIYNLIGSLVYSQPIGKRESNKDINLSALESGIYVARVSDSGRVLATKKITKED